MHGAPDVRNCDVAAGYLIVNNAESQLQASTFPHAATALKAVLHCFYELCKKAKHGDREKKAQAFGRDPNAWAEEKGVELKADANLHDALRLASTANRFGCFQGTNRRLLNL